MFIKIVAILPCLIFFFVGAITAMATDEIMLSPQDYTSGLEGTTSFKMVSGVRDGADTTILASIEFSITPIEEGKPIMSKAIAVKSDNNGRFKIFLPPGKYLIGPKVKSDGQNGFYGDQDPYIVKKEIEIVREKISRIDIEEIGHAP